MKLIAKVTLVTPDGEVPPGGEVEIKNKVEAESLIDRGFASLPPVARKGGIDESTAQKTGEEGGEQP